MTKADRYPSQVFFDERDQGYVAIAPDLPGCSAFGRTKAKALKELEKAIDAWISSVDPHTEAIPQPSSMPKPSSHSGKILVRVPASLHARLAADARTEGVSLNQWIVSVLSAGPSYNSSNRAEKMPVIAFVGSPVRTERYFRSSSYETISKVAAGSGAVLSFAEANTGSSPWSAVPAASSVTSKDTYNG